MKAYFVTLVLVPSLIQHALAPTVHTKPKSWKGAKDAFYLWSAHYICVHLQTCLELFFKRMNFPSMSISSIETFPVAEAEWEMLTLLLASDSSTSILFLFPLVVRTLRLDEARETVTRDDGLAESCNLLKKGRNMHTSHFGFTFSCFFFFSFYKLPFLLFFPQNYRAKGYRNMVNKVCYMKKWSLGYFLENWMTCCQTAY